MLHAIKTHLAELEAGTVPARDKPTALQHGLLRMAVDEIERLRAAPAHTADEVAGDMLRAAWSGNHTCTPDIYVEATGNHLCGNCGRRV